MEVYSNSSLMCARIPEVFGGRCRIVQRALPFRSLKFLDYADMRRERQAKGGKGTKHSLTYIGLCCSSYVRLGGRGRCQGDRDFCEFPAEARQISPPSFLFFFLFLFRSSNIWAYVPVLLI